MKKTLTDPRDAILPRIEAFLAKHNIAEASFGRMVAKNPSLVARLRKRSNVTVATIMAAERFMQEYRP